MKGQSLPTSFRRVFGETNANRRQLQIPATARDGLKPRRGGLFIANDRPKFVLFVFRRRGFCRMNADQTVGAQSPSAHGTVHRAAPPKNKKQNDDLCSSPINRPPLRGLWPNVPTVIQCTTLRDVGNGKPGGEGRGEGEPAFQLHCCLTRAIGLHRASNEVFERLLQRLEFTKWCARYWSADYSPSPRGRGPG